MNLRKAIYLTGSLVLTCGIALAQQAPPAPPSAPAPPSDLFSVTAQGPEFSLFFAGGSFLGVHAEDITKENMARYNMREVRGVGVTEVVKDSPAEKAGLRKDDVILRLEGDTVTSVRKLTRLVSEVAPDQTVRIAISRGGGEQEISATIAKRDNAHNAFHKFEGFEGLKKLEGLDKLKEFSRAFPEGGSVWKWEGKGKDGMTFSLGSHRRIGVSTMQLNKQLGDYFGVADGKGVLVTAVSDDSPAAKAGVKAGDIIIDIDGEKVEDSGDISRAINKKKDGDVTLTVLRNRDQKKFTITPKASESFIQPGTFRRADGGTIVIPRVALDIPEVNVTIPHISLPVIPPVSVKIPRTLVTPRIRTLVNQPI